MSLTAHQLLHKMRATTAATIIYCIAVVLAELPAAFVSFRWHQPSTPPTQNVNSAPSSLLSACHFSGNYAKSALNAAKSATTVTFEYRVAFTSQSLTLTDAKEAI